MIPFTPHLAHECLDLHGCKNVNEWPKIQGNVFEEVKIAVQVNGKTRDVMSFKKDLGEYEVKNVVEKASKAKKFIQEGKVLKIIFVKNRIINYIIKN